MKQWIAPAHTTSVSFDGNQYDVNEEGIVECPDLPHIAVQLAHSGFIQAPTVHRQFQAEPEKLPDIRNLLDSGQTGLQPTGLKLELLSGQVDASLAPFGSGIAIPENSSEGAADTSSQAPEQEGSGSASEHGLSIPADAAPLVSSHGHHEHRGHGHTKKSKGVKAEEAPEEQKQEPDQTATSVNVSA